MSTPLPQHLPAGDDVPVVVLVSASWAGPSRPAPTVLRELGRRWGTAVRTLLVENPEDEVLDAWGVEVVPTWMRFVRQGSGPTTLSDTRVISDASTSSDARSATSGQDRPVRLVLAQLEGVGHDGASVRLEGPWDLTHRLEGAQPKHAVDAVLGPDPAS